MVTAVEVRLGDHVADFPVAGGVQQQTAEHGLFGLDRMRGDLHARRTRAGEVEGI